MRQCSGCGNILEEGDVFCRKCGARWEQSQTPQAPAEDAVQPSEDSTPIPPPPTGPETPEPLASPDSSREQPPMQEPLLQPDGEGSLPEPEEPTYSPQEPGAPPPADQGEQQPGGPVFCSACGNRLTPGNSFCAVCGTKVQAPVHPEGIIPVSQPYYTPRDEGPGGPQKAKKSNPVPVIIVVCVAVLLLLGVGGFLLYKFLPFGGSKPVSASGESPIVYVKDDSILRYKTSEMERAETITGSFDARPYYDWEMAFLSRPSRSGNYILYLNDFRELDYSSNGRGDLYLRDISTLPKEGEPSDKGVKIASDVTTTFFFNEDESLVIYQDYNGNLYGWDFEESYRIDSDVQGVYAWDEEVIVYYKGDAVDDYISYFDSRDYYLSPLSKDNSSGRTKIDSDIGTLLDVNEDLTKFLYTKAASGSKDEGTFFDLYLYDRTEDSREKLLSDIGAVVDADVESMTAVYLMPRSSTITFDDLIDDDMARSDATLVAPSMTDYPVLGELYEELVDALGYEIFYYSEDEILELLELFLYYYGEDEEYDAEEMLQLREELKEYSEAGEEYQAKLFRDELRERIKDELDLDLSVGLQFYDLHILKDGERSKIDSGLLQTGSYSYTLPVNANAEQGTIIYLKSDLSDIAKIKLSELSDNTYSSVTFSVEDYLTQQMLGRLYLYTPDGESVQLDMETEDKKLSARSAYLEEDLSGIYFLTSNGGSTYSGGTTDLYYAEITGSTVGQPERVDDDLDYFYDYLTYQGKRLYQKNLKSGKCDLYAISGTDKERIGYDVAYYGELGVFNRYDEEKEELLFFFENYDSTLESGDFYLYTGDKTLVSEDVVEFYYRSEDLIYVLKNYRAGKGDLYVYDGESLSLVDYDVTGVLEDYLYSYY